MSRTLTCLLLLLSLAIWGCSARSYSIEEGLAEIAQAYPALTFSPATFPIRLPWTDTVAQACEADPLSAPTNGIVCLASSSIAGLVMYVVPSFAPKKTESRAHSPSSSALPSLTLVFGCQR